mgnify:CR=1 FL=1
MTEGFLGRWSKRKQASLAINTPTDAKAVQVDRQKISVASKVSNTDPTDSVSYTHLTLPTNREV